MSAHHLFIISIAGLLSTACSSDSDSTNPLSSNAITTAHAIAIQKVETMTVAKPTASLVAAKGLSFGSNWTTTATIYHPKDSGGSNPYSNLKVTVKEYMGYQFDASAKKFNGSSLNLFGRIRDAMAVFCALGKLLPASSIDANGYPVNGSHNITFTAANESAIATECLKDISDLTGQTLVMIVSSAAETTYYDKRVQFTLPGDPDPIYVYLHSSSAAVNLASFERSSEGRYRTLVHVDQNNKTTRMEYLSLPPTSSPNSGGVYGYRMYLDETADEGYILVREGGSSTDLAGIRYALAAKPKTTGSDISLSMTSTLLGDTANTDSHEACYEQTGTLVTDGSLCTVPSLASLVPAAATVLANLHTDRGTTGLYTNQGPSVNPGTFNATTLYTTNFSW